MPNYNNTIVNRDTLNPEKPRVSFLGAERGYQKLTKYIYVQGLHYQGK